MIIIMLEISGNQSLASFVSRSRYSGSWSVCQQGRGYHRARQQGHCTHPAHNCRLLLLLGHFPAICFRGNHIHIHSKLWLVNTL